MLLVTNNPAVSSHWSGTCEIRFIEGGYDQVLTATRDLVHLGHKLLTHPQAGSVKPNETPYRSILLTQRSGKLDTPSLLLMEEAIAALAKFPARPQRGQSAEARMRADFAEIDLRLLGDITTKEC